MLVVEDGVRDTRLGQERRQMRLPDALGQPRPERALSEDRVDPIGKRPNLADPVAPWHSDQNGLVVPAGEKLDLASADEVSEVADDVRTVRFEPIEERAREVKAGLYLRMPIQGGDERGIRSLGHVLEN
jgi:hypothetical protein